MKLTSQKASRIEAAALEASLAPGRRYPSSSLIERRPLSPRTDAELHASCRALVLSHAGAAERAYEVQGDAHANLAQLHRTARLDSSRQRPHVSQAQKSAPAMSSQRLPSNEARKSIVPRESQRNFLAQPTLHPDRDVDSRRRAPDPAKRPSNRLRKDPAHLNHLRNNPRARSSVQLGGSRWTNLTSARGSEANLHRSARDHGRSQDVQLSRSRSVPYSLSGSARVSVANLAKNVKSEIQEYIRPGSSHLSRKGSRASMRSAAGASESHPENTEHVWRSWGLQRRPSRGSVRSSRPGSRSRKDSGDRTTDLDKKKVNLNRDLPPLPGLDTWKKESSKGITHIANLMRTDLVDSEAAGRSSALDFSCVGSPTEAAPATSAPALAAVAAPAPAAAPTPKSDHARNVYQPRREQSSKKTSQSSAQRQNRTSSSRSSSEKASSKRDSTQDQPQPQHAPKRSSSRYSISTNSQRRQDSGGLASSRTSMRTSVDSNADGNSMWPLNSASSPSTAKSGDGRPNYSRKGMRTPGSSFGRSGSGQSSQYVGTLKQHVMMYPNVVEIKALKPAPAKERGLKRVLSVLAFKGRGQEGEDWMTRVEKLGAKQGVMEQDETATGAAVVRY